MPGIYVAKPLVDVTPKVPPNWDFHWIWPGPPFSPGYFPNYAVSLTAAQRIHPGDVLANTNATITDTGSSTTTKPDGQLSWNATINEKVTKLKNPGDYEDEIQTDYEEDSEGFWGDEPELYFEDNTVQNLGKTINLVVTAGPFNYTLKNLVDMPLSAQTFTYYFTADVDVLITEENAGFTVVPTSGLVTTRDSGTDSFTVCLTCQPTADVHVPVKVDNTAEATVDKTSLTFQTGDWSIPQTVTITGKDDHLTRDVKYHIVLGPASSKDRDYSGKYPSAVSVTNSGYKIIVEYTISVSAVAGQAGSSSAEGDCIFGGNEDGSRHGEVAYAEDSGQVYYFVSDFQGITTTIIPNGRCTIEDSKITITNIFKDILYELNLYSRSNAVVDYDIPHGGASASSSVSCNIKIYDGKILLETHPYSISTQAISVEGEGPASDSKFKIVTVQQNEDNTFTITEL